MEDVYKEITDWMVSQPLWVQRAAVEIYTSNDVGDELIEELLQLIRTLDHQVKYDIVGDIFKSASSSGVANDICLVSIGDIKGIDALSPKTPLPFSEKLSVIYGGNGSGKSGYVRILKKISGKPNAVELQPNVFKPYPEERECTVVASINGLSKEFKWEVGQSPVSELASVDVFDSQTGIFYIDKEHEVSYVPKEVALFEELAKVYKKLQDILKLERDSIKSSLPSKPSEFGSNKYISAMYEKLRPDANLDALKTYFNFTDDDRKELEAYEERLEKAPLELADKKKKRLVQLDSFLDSVNSALLKVSESAVSDLAKLEMEALEKRRISIQAAEGINDESKLVGFGSETWGAMWKAARNYSEQGAYSDSKFPFVGKSARCVLCHQLLTDGAKNRLLKFESYVTSELEREAVFSENEFKARLSDLPVRPTESELITLLRAAQLDEQYWLGVINDTWNSIEEVVLNCKDLKRDSFKFFNSNVRVFEGIKNISDNLRSEIEQHKKDAESFDKPSIVRDCNELKAKRWASGYVESMIEEVQNLKNRKKIDEWLKMLNTSSVSKVAGKISVKIITEAFVGRFKTELNKLGANNIKVDLVKTRTDFARSHHRIQLKDLSPHFTKSKAMGVLSEGEQRIVSLAAFLADVTSKKNSAPFIFDDPISSLDQTYEEHVVKRLIELSRDRQVIVFTHRLSLLGLLVQLGQAESVYIRREPWGSGEHTGVPIFGKKPIKAVNDLKNSKLSAARKAYESDGYDAYYPLAKSICSDFRILLERIVENDFLADVVSRHRREVNTLGKVKKLAKITPEDCSLIEDLMSQFSCYEHSQSDEMPVDIPSPDILLDAMDRIIQWHKDFDARESS